jgi:hypothetical protein
MEPLEPQAPDDSPQAASVAGPPERSAPPPARPLAEPLRFVGEPGPPLPPRGEAALRSLPIKGISRRRMGWIAAAAISLWVLAVFVRQVGDASAAQDRAAEIRAGNADLAARVAALAAEKQLIQQPAYVAFTARSYGLGLARGERPFVLAPGAPELPADAPGSASLRVGRVVDDRTPLDSWLELLFGPER